MATALFDLDFICDYVADAFSNELGTVGIRSRQENGELLTPVSRANAVTGRCRFAQQGRQPFEGPVALQVAMRVVQELKMVCINDQKAYRKLGEPSPPIRNQTARRIHAGLEDR